ncbi:MAG: hypothetical protein KDD55_00490 [Bdellovibrionales bacterium]|nr:hypothetical protein [Bdellovibrionales bacterium]
MTDLAFWKLALDGALVLSLIFFCVLYGRRSAVSPRHLHGLEDSLRRIVKEADNASSGLAQELMKNKRELEQLLYDLETMETRLSKGIDEADETRKALLSTAKRVQSVGGEERKRTIPETSRVSERVVDHHQAEERAEQVMYEMPEPPSFESMQNAQRQQIRSASEPQMNARPESKRPSASSAVERHAAASADHQQPVNIYGEPLGQGPNKTLYRETPEDVLSPQQPLAASVEKIVEERSPAIDTAAIEEIYEAAEKLLRAGRDVRYVSAQTHLPMEEVQTIARMLRDARQERQPAPKRSHDPRLGALSHTIKRERHVI